MATKELDVKEDAARDVAMLVVEHEKTDVTHETVKSWTADAVYEWIEAWNYIYEDGEWVLDEEDDMDWADEHGLLGRI